jgi:hypothetical protein
MPSPDHPPPTPAELSSADVSRIIEMAWEDRTPFEAILRTYGLAEPAKSIVPIAPPNTSSPTDDETLYPFL